MIHCVILMTMMVIEVKNFKTGSASSPTIAIATPSRSKVNFVGFS
jgi:hypothetical protein